MTSQQEARDALDAHAVPVYRKSLDPKGAVYLRLVDLLTNPISEDRRPGRPSKTSETFRNLLWDAFTGGGTSAKVTQAVFAAVGREDETDPNWI